MKTNTAIVICAAIIVCAFILGGAYKYKYKEQNTIVVTGLGWLFGMDGIWIFI